jgi:hypothetical protein
MRSHTLETIAEWLESEHPPTREEATALFEEVIPSALDAAIGMLHLQSVVLLRQAHELAGLADERLRAVLSKRGMTGCPPSCAMCDDAKPIYSHGAYLLRCTHGDEDDAKQEPTDLARVAPEVAFRQPADMSRAQLLEQAAGIEPPEWCPRR